MKRSIVLLVLLVACAAGFLITKGIFPSLFVSDESMEPELPSGSLMTIKRLNPEDIKLGDTIVYNVPKTIREYYNYPAVVSHKVVEIRTTPSLGFRTKGNKTGEDPFTVKPSDVRGLAGARIPYLDLPLKLFQNQAGLIIVLSALALLAVLLYSREIIALIRIRMPFLFIHDIKLNKRASPPELKVVEKKATTKEPVQLQPDRAAKHLAKPFIPVLDKPALPTDNQKYKKISKEIPTIKTETTKPSIPVLKPVTIKDKRNHEEPPAVTPIIEEKTEKPSAPILEPVLPHDIQKHEEIPAVTPIIEEKTEKAPVPILEPVLPHDIQKHEEIPAVTPIAEKKTEKAPVPILEPALPQDSLKHEELPAITPIAEKKKAKPSIPILEPVLLHDIQKHEEIPAVTPIAEKETEKAPVPILESALPQDSQKHEELPAVTPITEEKTEKPSVPILEPALPQDSQKLKELPAVTPIAEKETQKAPIQEALNKAATSKPGRTPEKPDEAMKAEKELYEALDRLNSILKKYKNQE
jgi:signal peptidase I